MADLQMAAVRLRPSAIVALDKIAAEHEAAGISKVSRSDVLRKIIEEGIAAHAATSTTSPTRPRARHRTT